MLASPPAYSADGALRPDPGPGLAVLDGSEPAGGAPVEEGSPVAKVLVQAIHALLDLHLDRPNAGDAVAAIAESLPFSTPNAHGLRVNGS